MKKVIILFGPPGAGKGTQASLLSEKFGLYYFETSKILEAAYRHAQGLSTEDPRLVLNIEGEDYNLLDEHDKWKKGILNSPPFVTSLVLKKLEALAKSEEPIVLAGSPRTLYEAERIAPQLLEWYGRENITAFLIELAAEDTIFRNSHRRICELMRHSILHGAETAGLTMCPLDGSKLVIREGLDDPDTITVRLKEYADRTMPLFAHFEKLGIAIQKINGGQPVAKVFADIVKYLT